MDFLEKRDLYDINRKLTGEFIYKGQPIPRNRKILVVLVFIQNSNGDFLIQKRSIQKGGLYASTGGHPKSGETSIQGMITEIKEEIGLNIPENELKLFYSDSDDEVFFDLYYAKKDIDISSLTLQKEEVESVEWFSINQIQQLVSDEKFLKSHSEAFEKTLIFLKNPETKMVS